MTKALFTRIAGVYDRMNHLLSLGLDLRWRRLATGLVHGNPSRILDLAAGTGDFSFALARRFPKASVVGIDLTPAMLERAKAKNRSRNVVFREGDAQRPQADPASVQLVSCAFGFRNFPDKAAALESARSVLTDDGELLVLEFFRPEGKFLAQLTALWVRLLVRLFCRDNSPAYGYLRESMRTTVSVAEFVRLAAERGFVLADRRFYPPCCTCLHFRAG